MRGVGTLREDFHRITKSPLDNKIKIALLEGMVAGLREEVERRERAEKSGCCQSGKSELAETTALSHLSLLSNEGRVLNGLLETTQEETESLQNKIISKQREKMELNQEIETMEEDCFQRQRVLLSRRDLCDKLDQKIAKQTHRISKEASKGGHCKTMKVQEGGGLSDRLKSLFIF